MIVSASYKTDIPAFYGSWFRARMAAGFADVTNPWGGPPFRVDLRRQAVDGFVFWTRNAAPFLDELDPTDFIETTATDTTSGDITGADSAVDAVVADDEDDEATDSPS